MGDNFKKINCFPILKKFCEWFPFFFFIKKSIHFFIQEIKFLIGRFVIY